MLCGRDTSADCQSRLPGSMKLSHHTSLNTARMGGRACVLAFLCFAMLRFSFPLIGQPQAPVPAGPQERLRWSGKAATRPNLLRIPQPTPSTDPAVRQQVADAWSEFQAVA